MTEPSPWSTEQLDLDAYLARIGASPAPPSRAALDALHEAHVRSFTFDNIDVLLDQHPACGSTPCRRSSWAAGGAATASSTWCCSRPPWNGWATTSSDGSGASATRRPRRGRTASCVVTVDGERLLADPGFGMSVLRPIPLADGAEDDYGGWRYRLRSVPVGRGRGWALNAGATSTGS